MKKIMNCKCGKKHISSVKFVVTENGAIQRLPEFITTLRGTKPFILADQNTWVAAGEKAVQTLERQGIPYVKFIFGPKRLLPEEHTVGSAVMHYDSSCDIIVGIGSGVINDVCKILSKISGKPYIIVATAPSMDGYASNSSSMELDGLKVSLPTKCPDVIIGDLEVLKNAPQRMLLAGLGDMLAKYVSICEWRISHLITGEYYCEYVASLVRSALKKCVDNAAGLVNREESAVKAVFEGLVLTGKAMEYTGITRAASGTEHSISHIWDMRSLAFGANTDFHGIQCGIATLLVLRLYEQIKEMKPDPIKAVKHAESFDLDAWNKQLYEFLGPGAKAMIELERKQQKYDVKRVKEQVECITENWDKILRIIDEELPSSKSIENLLDRLGAPKSCEEIGIEKDSLPMTFKATKDLRDKFILSRLCYILDFFDELNYKKN